MLQMLFMVGGYRGTNADKRVPAVQVLIASRQQDRHGKITNRFDALYSGFVVVPNKQDTECGSQAVRVNKHCVQSFKALHTENFSIKPAGTHDS